MKVENEQKLKDRIREERMNKFKQGREQTRYDMKKAVRFDL